ncbi:hypothetical protein ACFO9E_26100 [Streptomyces maoxianensis]|uniref:Uncharacterized protein n=1 Tax=Streptomyces maoxianensis TaxID=1459942 RepID=A0ABV9GDW7_9ACTN
MKAAVHHRMRIAAGAAAEMLSSGTADQVWLEGALACGFAHAASDIDLRGIVGGAELPRWGSRMVDGIRVDPQASSPQEIAELRQLLRTFDVRRDDLTSFRQARRAMHELMCLRTALSYRDGAWHPILTSEECEGYRRWAVADQAEVAASLAEDLVGLLESRLFESAHVVCRKLETCLLALDAAASGHPVLGAKWLPLLARPAINTVAPSVSDDGTRGDSWAWFRPTQRRITLALLTCWPTDATPGPPPAIADPAAGWLPQRYADGWFLRLGDTHLPVDESTLLGWLAAVSVDEQ